MRLALSRSMHSASDMADVPKGILLTGVQGSGKSLAAKSERYLSAENFDLLHLADHAEGFSGAEIEQAVVAAIYSAAAQGMGGP